VTRSSPKIMAPKTIARLFWLAAALTGLSVALWLPGFVWTWLSALPLVSVFGVGFVSATVMATWNPKVKDPR